MGWDSAAASKPAVTAIAVLIIAAMTAICVLGTYSESPLRGAMLGSTPHKLLHLSKVPVIAVPA